MDNKIKGIIKAVNKNGILLLTPEEKDGQWWNGLGACSAYIIPELKGKEVEITIINQEKRTFSYLEACKESEVKEVIKPSYDEEGREPERDRIIVRQNAGSQASSFIQCMVANGYYQVLDAKKIKEDYFKFASEFETWVFRKC